MTPIIARLDDLAGRYDALFCDLWGCVHDGIRAYPAALAALDRFRAGGGTVVLVTNSPRPRAHVARQLAAMGVEPDRYDAIASSGDAAQDALAAGDFGRRVHHIGPPHDLPFFTDHDGRGPIAVERVPLAEAEGIVCTGLFDDRTETPDDYRATILGGVNRGLKLLCANPDLFVDRGPVRVWCAGAIAAAYAAAGGESRYFGKPHAPIYDLARRRLAGLRTDDVDEARILCVGDGIATDIAGGVGEGLDTLFVTGGLAAEEMGGDPERPDPARLDAYLAQCSLTVTAAIGRLR